MSAEFDFATSQIDPGISVIEASAGTGKTYAISHLVARLLLDGVAENLGEILLVTFTNDAARELAARVRRVLEKLHAPPSAEEEQSDHGVHRLRQKYVPDRIATVIGRALLDLDRLGVSTIHSFCQRTLQSEGTLCGLPVVPELIPDADEFIEKALYELWETNVAGDKAVSAVAASAGWNVAEELRFVRQVLPLEKVAPVPEPRSFAVTLRELDEMAGDFTDEVCNELSTILRQVSKWTLRAPAEADRETILKTLNQAQHVHDPGFLEAARTLELAETWIDGKGKGGDFKRDAGASRAVGLAKEVSSTLARLRWDFRWEIIARVRETVASRLRANRKITYDGLIEALASALKGAQARPLAERLRSRYKVALIDESQDTDARQFEIFRRVFVGFEGEPSLASHRLVLIGDPKQAIYAFRGADVNTYLAACELAGEQIFRLTKTFRAPEPLVQAVNALFARDGSLLKDGLTFAEGSSGLKGDVQLVMGGVPSAARVEAWVVPDEDAEHYGNRALRSGRISGLVATEITKILNARSLVRHSEGNTVSEKPIHPGDIAVLVSTHEEAEAMGAALQVRGVPAIRAGTEDVMATEEATELQILLRAMHEPRRSGWRMAALATRMLGRNAVDLRGIQEDSALEDEYLQKFQFWQEIWDRRGIAPALAQVDADEGVTSRLATLVQGERRLTNLRQISDLLQAASVELGHRPGHLVRWFAQEIACAGVRSNVEERQQQLESDADAVQLVTMHAAKGLEYPLVFCPFLWGAKAISGVQKLSLPGQPTQLVDTDLSTDPAIRVAIDRAALEDRLRLAYVAVTRAKAKVWILGGEICSPRNKVPASALDWLLRADGVKHDEAWRELAAQLGRGTRHTESWRSLAANRPAKVISWGNPPPPSGEKWTRPRKTGVSLAALPAPVMPAAWGMTSFSALTREKNPHSDGAAPVAEAPFELVPAPHEGNPFLNAPGGALVGTAVHDWIEGWDFSSIRPEALGTHLTNFPLAAPKDGHTLSSSMLGMLKILPKVRLPGLDCTIQTACPRPESSEWHFQLPISVSLSAQKLADVFAAHGHREYAARLGTLPVEELAGYLHGFLDRIAFHDGAWGVIDWKTNQLGRNMSDYQPASLQACASQAHYLLQAHLYLVALRRYLGPGVRVAGAWLVFLRGIRAGTSEGVLHVDPSEDLMQALDELFAQPSTPLSK